MLDEDVCPLCGSSSYEVKDVFFYILWKKRPKDKVEEMRKCKQCGITYFRWVPSWKYLCRKVIDCKCK